SSDLYLSPALGIFGLGLVVGAGVTVMLVPQARQRIRDRFERGTSQMKQRLSRARHQVEEFADDLEELTRDELMERAQAMDIQTHANMSKSELVQAIASS